MSQRRVVVHMLCRIYIMWVITGKCDISLHCHLRSPILPVTVGFNHLHAHMHRACMISAQWVNARLSRIQQIFRAVRLCSHIFSEVTWLNCTSKSGQYIGRSSALAEVCFRFQTLLLFDTRTMIGNCGSI